LTGPADTIGMSSGAHRTKAASFASRDQEARSISSDGGGMQYFSLRWNNHPVNLVSGFSGLYNSETLVDVTLAAEGRHLQAHRMLLSACSDYFQSLFSVNPCQHPIVILKDVNFEDLKTVVQFMYNGIVNVSSEKLPAVLKVKVMLYQFSSKYHISSYKYFPFFKFKKQF